VAEQGCRVGVVSLYKLSPKLLLQLSQMLTPIGRTFYQVLTECFSNVSVMHVFQGRLSRGAGGAIAPPKIVQNV